MAQFTHKDQRQTGFLQTYFLARNFKGVPFDEGLAHFPPLSEFSNTYNIRIEPLKYFGLISALRYLYNSNFSGNEPRDPVTSDSFLEAFSKSNKVNRVVYGKLVDAKSTSPRKSQLKWNDRIIFYKEGTADWKSAYCLAAKCTKSTKLINFQYRLLHRVLPTNLF